MALLEELIDLPPAGKEQEPLQEKDAAALLQKPGDAVVLKIVNQDFQKSDSWLASIGKFGDWNKCDRLFQFRVPVQTWEGTDILRAHLGMPVVLEHIESILPQVMIGFFAEHDQPFMSKPRPGTKMEAARANDKLLAWELKEAGFREEFRLLGKSTLQYGNGIGKWGWKRYTREFTELSRKGGRQFVPTEIGGVLLGVDDDIEETLVKEVVNRPFFEQLDLRRVRVNSSLSVPDIRKAKFVIHEMYLTLNQLEELRDLEGYDIPEQKKLVQLFFPPKESVKPSILGNSSLDINADFGPSNPAVATTIDPYNIPLRLLEYWTPKKSYTVLQERLVIRNMDNQFGRVPFVSSVFIDILGSFYGFGIAHVVGGEQRLQQGVQNTFLDDLSLTLNGMFIRKRGANVPWQQIRMHPGGAIETDEADGIQLLDRKSPTMDVMAVIGASDSRAQRRTGANELLVQGSMPAAGSSITRTATGAQMFGGGVAAKLQYFVENLADQVFIPVLDAFHLMNRKYLKPSDIQRICGSELGIAYPNDPLDLLNVRTEFEILAAAKLQAKRAMAQSLPLLLQFFMTAPVIDALSQQGKKLDVLELSNMVYDVSGWPNRSDVIVDMTEEDTMRMMANNPAIQQVMAQRQKAQQDQANTLEQVEEETIARAGRDELKHANKLEEIEHAAAVKPAPTKKGGKE